MLTKIELICFSILAVYGIVVLYWGVSWFIRNIKFGRVSRYEKETLAEIANRPLVVNVIDHWRSKEELE